MEVRRRVLRALMIVPLVLACVAGVAHAEVYYNDADNGDYQGLVAGYEYGELGQHRAAMEYLGFDWDSIGSVQQARLRTNSGGKNPYMAVYEQAQNLQYDYSGGAFDWPILNVWSSIFGLSNIWLFGGITHDDYDVAREYVLKVIQGGSTGGGGEVDVPEGMTFMEYKTAPAVNELYGQGRINGSAGNELYSGTIGSDGQITGAAISPKQVLAYAQRGAGTVSGTTYVYKPEVTFNLTTAAVNLLNAEVANGCDIVVGLQAGSSSPFIVYAIPKGGYELRTNNVAGNPVQVMYIKAGTTYKRLSAGTQRYFLVGDKAYAQSTGTVLGSNRVSSDTGFTFGYLLIDSGEVVMPNPEPDPPTVTPTPPETPTYVFEPVLGVDFPTVTIETDPVSDEIIDWLKLIHRDLSRISQEMNDYIEDASNAIVAAINNQGAALRRWFDTLSTQINDVYTYLVTMQERYLNELDRDLVTWLKRIYSRLGGNGAAEPDPNEDEKGFWDWILEQLQKFFVGNVDEAADGIKGLLQQLTEFFPFSLPWDLMALFGLFAAEPVTPVFDVQLPVPAVISADYGEPLHIDLHQWDGIMIVVRGLEKIFFAAWLISMVPTWLNDIKVGDM